MKKPAVLSLVLLSAAAFAFAIGVNGGWALGKAYFGAKEAREASHRR